MADGVLKQIVKNVKYGMLPRNFKIEEDEKLAVRFAPGAMDGSVLFHCQNVEKHDAAEKIAGLLKEIFGIDAELSNERKKAVRDEIKQLVVKNRCVGIVNPLISLLCDDIDSYNLVRLHTYAEVTLTDSREVEMVKFAVSLMSLFEHDDDNLIKKLMYLSLYEELTIYCIGALGSLPDFNEVVFGMAERMHGWGKIHAVNKLVPETEEIRRWILSRGCANTVSDEYLALVCAEKGDMIGELRKEKLDKDVFEGICIIMNALIEEEIMQGLHVYDDAEEALVLFIRHGISFYGKTSYARDSLMRLKMWFLKTEWKNKAELLEMLPE